MSHLWKPLFSIAAILAVASAAFAEAPPGGGALVQDGPPSTSYEFGGPVGERIDANIDQWLLRAPLANPGMIEMFRARDRKPAPNLVPWAGEFVGKYLISAIQALRMSDDPRLEQTVADVIAELISTQAEDGYLGPFPKNERLLGQWDLWGHYHVLLALMMWHERRPDSPGGAAALAAARRAADLACKTYLGAGRRVIDAGSTEMNMTILTAMGFMHRATGEPRYLELMREVEKDWERAGDYARQGAAGVPFHRTPSPRWESLHDLQGLVELYRITGDATYRAAFLNLWKSIRHWDRRNSGAFSSGEQATGHPYAETAIETCCVIAWMAVTIDALRLIDDPRIADELELSTYNAAMGAQHPTGRWWTYNTPMNGAREASAHTIVFQSRAGTPELNCCSVNGPRALGMLSEWAVMTGGDAEADAAAPILTINYLGPMTTKLKLADGTRVTIKQETLYPIDGAITTRLELDKPSRFVLRIRVPGWAAGSSVSVLGETQSVEPGGYFAITREWATGEAIETRIGLPLRADAGDEEMVNQLSIYRGPLLLAYDQRFNDFDEADIPELSLGNIRTASAADTKNKDETIFAPWLLLDLPAEGGGTIRLCDFASAGALGTRYRSWLPCAEAPPPPPVPDLPNDGAAVPAGRILFKWRPAPADVERDHRVIITRDAHFENIVLTAEAGERGRLILDEVAAAALVPGIDYFWKIISSNAHGQTDSAPFPKRFRIDPALPPLDENDLAAYGEGPDGIMIDDPLAGEAKPSYGALDSAKGVAAASDRMGEANGAVATDGRGGMIVYKVKRFPEADVTMSVWVNLTEPPKHLAQIFSAWSRGGDDPLRVCVDGGTNGGKVFARVEGAGAHTTEGIAITPGRWTHLAAVKSSGKLKLYVDGKPAATAQVPRELYSSSTAVALGGNPRFTGDEFLAASFADFKLHARALSEEEIKALAME